MAEQINIGVWKRGLADVYRSNSIGAGSVALLQLLNLQLGQAHEMVGHLSDDAFVQRSVVGWRETYDAVQWRLGWMIRRLQAIASSGKNAPTRALEIWNFVARPVLEGQYPAEMMDAARGGRALAGIRMRNGKDWSDGGVGFGEAVMAATLWNQASVVGDFDRSLGTGWATNVVRSWLTEVARQLEQTAPGEDPTIADATVVTLRRLAEAPGAILRAVGIEPTLLLAGGALLVVTLWVLTKR